MVPDPPQASRELLPPAATLSPVSATLSVVVCEVHYSLRGLNCVPRKQSPRPMSQDLTCQVSADVTKPRVSR